MIPHTPTDAFTLWLIPKPRSGCLIFMPRIALPKTRHAASDVSAHPEADQKGKSKECETGLRCRAFRALSCALWSAL
jgi:hypothetical protein